MNCHLMTAPKEATLCTERRRRFPSAEKLLVQITTHVSEGQCCNGGFVGEQERRSLHPNRCSSIHRYPIHPHWPTDVLDLLLGHILTGGGENGGQPAFDAFHGQSGAPLPHGPNKLSAPGAHSNGERGG